MLNSECEMWYVLQESSTTSLSADQAIRMQSQSYYKAKLKRG